MRRGILALLLLSMLMSGAIEQTFVHTMSSDGNSTMAKTMDISLFATQLPGSAMQKVESYCRSGGGIVCTMNAGTKVLGITETLRPGGYYTYTADYGLPFVTYTLTVSSLPNDVFAADIDNILRDANVTTRGSAAVKALDLTDKTGNAESLPVLKRLKANLTYTVTMPAAIAEAKAGKVKGSVSGPTASFDLLDVMGEGAPIVVVSRELNSFTLVAILAVLTVGAMSYSFFFPKKKTRGRK